MGRQYSAKTFLRNTPNDLLKQYFQERGIDLGFNWSYRHKSDVNPVFAAMENLPEAMRSRVDGDFSMINDLACEAGVLAILDKAGGRPRGLADRFAKMKNAYERAFWTFLHEPELSRLAGCFHEMDRRLGWRRRFVGVRLDVATDDDALRAFEQALRMFYRRQGRGRFCHVDYHLRHDPLRHCFFAYPEDYASTDVGYDDHGRFQQRARRCAFELIFVYRPEEGILEVRAQGKGKDVTQLDEIFCKAILGLVELPADDGRLPYDLTVLKNADFAFPTDPKDRIASVEVQTLRLDLPFVQSKGTRRRITVSANSLPDAPRAAHRLLHEAINKEHVRLADVHVSQAKLRVTFEPTDGQRPKTLTFDVTYPDRCTLKDAPYDQIAKKYLEEWGIARA